MSRTSDLAQQLSLACIAYRDASKTNPHAASEHLERMKNLAMDAVARAREVGWGTVDHIVLASVLGLVQEDIPALTPLLEMSGWVWPD